MGSPISSQVNAGDDVLKDQYNNLRTDALNPGSMGEPTNLADFLKSARPKDLLNSLGDFEAWTRGADDPPLGWSRGTSATNLRRAGFGITQSGNGIQIFTNGGYVWRRINNVRRLRGKYVTLVGWVSNGTLSIVDNAGTTTSSNPGGTHSFVSVERQIDASATFVEIRVTSASALSHRADRVSLYEGRFAWAGEDEEVSRLQLAVTGITDTQVYSPSRDDNIPEWMDGFGTSWTDIGPFPDPAVIVATGSKVAIYDTEGLSWMEFNAGSNNILDGVTNATRQIHMRNGKLFICWDNSTPDSSTGLVMVDFVADVAWRFNNSGGARYGGTIYDRDGAKGYGGLSNKTIKLANLRPLSVHTQAIRGELFAVVGSQADGCSLISLDNTSPVRSAIIKNTASSAVYQVFLTSAGHLVYIDTNDERLYVKDDAVSDCFSNKAASGSNQTGAASFDRQYTANAYSLGATSDPTISASAISSGVFGNTGRRLDVTTDTLDHGVTKNKIFLAGNEGVSILLDDPIKGQVGSWATYIDKDQVSPAVLAKGFCWPLQVSNATTQVDTGPKARNLDGTGTPTFVDHVWNLGADITSGKYFSEKAEASYAVAGGSSGDLNIGDVAANTRQAQGFKVAKTCHIQAVYLRLKKVGTPTTNTLQAELQSDDGSGKPSNTAISDTISLDGTNLTTSYQWVRFAFTSATGDFTADTQYHIVLKRSGANDGANYYVIEKDTAGTYADGTISTYNGSTWANVSAEDFGFQIFTGDTARPGNSSTGFTQQVISGWITPDTTATDRTILAKWSSNTAIAAKAFRFYLNASDRLVYEVSGDGSTSYTLTSSISFEANKLYHVAVINDGTTASMYINGEKDPDATTSGSLPASIFTTGAKLSIGCSWSDMGDQTAENPFEGIISSLSMAYVGSLSVGSLIRRLWEAGVRAYGARIMRAGTSGGRTYSAKLAGSSNLVRTVALETNLLLVGTNDGADTGGLSFIDTLSFGRVDDMATVTIADKLGTLWSSGTGFNNIVTVSATEGFHVYATEAFAWLTEYTERITATGGGGSTSAGVSTHAGSHATGAGDQITPASIGAAASSHTTSSDHDDRYFTESESNNNFLSKTGQAVSNNNGTASAPTYSFTSDTNTGAYRGGSDIYSVAAGGSERFRVDTSNTPLSYRDFNGTMRPVWHSGLSANTTGIISVASTNPASPTSLSTSVNLDRLGKWLITYSFDFALTGSTVGYVVGVLYAGGGAVANSEVLFKAPLSGSAHEATVGRSVIYTCNAITTTLDLRAYKDASGTTANVGSYGGLVAVWISP